MNRKYQSGLSLTELAISITIIALIMASVIGGFSLLHSAKLRDEITRLNNIFAAIDEFKEEYDYMPGDFPSDLANSFWGSAIGGNADTNINYAADRTEIEDLYFWFHLGKSGLINGSYTGALKAADERYDIGSNSTRNTLESITFPTSAYMFKTEFTKIYDTRGHALRLAKLDADEDLTNGAISPKDAYSIDKKLDDGNPSTGYLYSMKKTTETGCVNAESTASSASYLLSNANETCILLYWYKKF